MKVKELIELLHKQDQEALVLVPKTAGFDRDDKRNSLKPLINLEDCLFTIEQGYKYHRVPIFKGDPNLDTKEFEAYNQDTRWMFNEWNDDDEPSMEEDDLRLTFRQNYLKALQSSDKKAVVLWSIQ